MRHVGALAQPPQTGQGVDVQWRLVHQHQIRAPDAAEQFLGSRVYRHARVMPPALELQPQPVGAVDVSVGDENAQSPIGHGASRCAMAAATPLEPAAPGRRARTAP